MTPRPVWALVAAIGGCIPGYQPWPAHVRQAPKPATPLSPPADKALIVVVHLDDNGGGNGTLIIFDETKTPIAEYPESGTGWTVAAIAPGKHTFYRHTYRTDYCVKFEAEVAAGKIYAMEVGRVRPILGPTSGGARWYTADQQKELAGGLHFTPYTGLDVGAASAALHERGADVEACMKSADFNARQVPAPQVGPGDGLDQVDFAAKSP